MAISKRAWVITLGTFAFILTLVGVGWYLVFGMQNPGLADEYSKLSDTSRQNLRDLDFCDVAHRFSVPADVLAGVVIAEKQLNRDLLDSIQDAWAHVMLMLQSDQWWQEWSDGDSNEINYSLGPSQITPRTAIKACTQLDNLPEVCADGAQQLVSAIMDDQKSLEVAAVVLVAERDDYLAKTGIDITDNAALWATIYNYGGDHYRSFFPLSTEQGTNRFGRWISRNSVAIAGELKCVSSG